MSNRLLLLSTALIKRTVYIFQCSCLVLLLLVSFVALYKVFDSLLTMVIRPFFDLCDPIRGFKHTLETVQAHIAVRKDVTATFSA